MDFDGILFFPVTPFDADGRVDDDLLREHSRRPSPTRPAGCSPRAAPESSTPCRRRRPRTVVRVATETVAGRVPVVAGTGGPLGHATDGRAGAADAGADALLVLPPYLVAAPRRDSSPTSKRWLRHPICPSSIYHRGNAQYSVDSVRRLAAQPEGRRLQGRRRRRRARPADRPRGGRDGPRRLRVLQRPADRGADAGRLPRHRHPAVFVGGVRDGPRDRERVLPRVRRRRRGAPRRAARRVLLARSCACATRRPGFGVSLIKAGLRLAGLAVGGVRPPLVDPTPEQEERLAGILEAGRALL